ncbi:two-component sensor histidine kinase [Rhodobacter xanthinilyticus]|uniref:histidine kinase n=1 Tax=Rhodobacter xanthinilyticus TaxID=1850250 RepID=A0A1D9MC65_9RHOB|nr:ATP-binding protein [Rhodobacter xanthinilyticus]AOZ69329.1 two-component sensor histidine kinase [Rhodobacter xanthinilyticus]
MNFGWLKQIMPRGLYGRAALILVVPIVTIQLVVSVVFIQRHFERVTRQMTATMLREIVLIEARVNTAPDAARAEIEGLELAAPLGLGFTLPVRGAEAEATGDARGAFDFTGIVVIDTLRAALPALRAVDLSRGARVRLTLTTGQGVLALEFPRDRVSASNPHQLLVLMLVVSLLMTVIAYLFLRNQLRPIRRLARAAEAFGRGQVVPYRPAGALEVRAAGRAFLEMRARIERQTESRRLMLSGISHDLRTPLTRMRLGLSILPDDPETRDEIAAMERDVAEMGKLVDAFLASVRDEATQGPSEEVDLGALVGLIVEDAGRGGQAVRLIARPAPGQVLLTCRPDSLRRALENLIGNAMRYGRKAEVSLRRAGDWAVITVEDDGPGIPEERYEEALKPFTRLDPARNQDRGQGVGLGLSIAADIARGHGGGLKLGRSARMGGLRVEMRLPL